MMSYHPTFLTYLNSMRLEITICLFVCAIGFWLRRVIGLYISAAALFWAGKIYLHWYQGTLATMRELEIADFRFLQGPDLQHVISMRYASWWDLMVLTTIIILFVWLLKMLVSIFMSAYVKHDFMP
jgi:hypothetical protein